MMINDEACSLSLYKNNNRDADPLWSIPLHGFDLNLVSSSVFGDEISSDEHALSRPHTHSMFRPELGIIEAINDLEAEFAQVSAKKHEALDEIVPGNETYRGLENEARIYGEVAERIRAILKAHGVYQDLPILPYQR